ncbi:hypothetical protein Bcp1_150 [Bacillus phage Bcp1]|uniref:Uncharacterized protein n=3 Tax=Caeruleovirus TaxID=1911929 RepID=A0A0S2MUN8_9CAUD|nr:hypothetical protein Bcp1_150 [Bacillus phage Bcp1]YP_009626710.1 hypothetical protein FD732_gp184 [Bacillus phage BM15]AHN66625.1 putative membrane protein [Bacillus phage Bcp1]ALO79565.1 hypothetical protein BM10_161 [Bacillus phage BM15]AXQ66916.1 hypothetical protein HOBO_158 [Bacillus phage Hobo]
MTAYDIVLVTLYMVVVVTFVTNNIQLYKESARLKEMGQTPLTGRNLSVVIVAFISEMLTVAGIMWCFQALDTPVNPWTVACMFIVGYLIRNIGAYVSAWVLWTIFVRIDKGKMKHEVEKEITSGKAL